MSRNSKELILRSVSLGCALGAVTIYSLNKDFGITFYVSALLSAFIVTTWLKRYFSTLTPSIEILNDYIIIEPIEVNQPAGLHRTVQDQSKLVYRDALVKFTPKNSIVKPGDTVIFNKSMAYPYILDGKQHLIITEEYIVCIK